MSFWRIRTFERGAGPAAGGLLLLSTLVASSVAGAPARASFPGANSKLVCVGAMDRTAAVDDTEIYSMNPDGSGIKFLTDNGPFVDQSTNSPLVNEDYPAVSPDGKTIAFESFRSGTSEIWSMNADGTGARRLTNAPDSDHPGSYSPDGSQIVLNNGSPQLGVFDVYKMDADGSNRTQLTFAPGHDSSPDWSPDGARIAFHTNRDAVAPRLNFEIYTMNTSGGDLKRLTFTDSPADAVFPDPRAFSGFDFLPRWSPDGTKLVFASWRDGNSEIYTMNAADGSGLTRLTNDPSRDEEPAWSPDGTKIVFDSPRSGDREVYTMNASDGSDVRRLTNNPGFDGRCDWSRIPPRGPAPLPPVYPQPAAAFAGCPSLTAKVIHGTAASNSIVGTPQADRIFAGAGDDTVDALAGDDCIDLGAGTDRGQGGAGNDLVVGGPGADRIAGSSGNDNLRGGALADRLIGGSGNDRLHGQSGSDRINGNSGNDRLAGSSGADRISGGSGRDRVSGGSGNDRISVRDRRRDRINCGTGRDRVIADRIDRIARNCERTRRL